MNLSIPQDAFSDGQVRSKLWLANSLNEWSTEHFNLNNNYSLTWYGSWVGLGPFLLLSLSKLTFTTLNLIEVDAQALETSRKLLSHWEFKGVQIHSFKEDMNSYLPDPEAANQLFINTACEHVAETQWLKNIPPRSKILLQSTNMAHKEHINLASSLADFKDKTKGLVSVQQESQLDVDYGATSFSRYMLFGVR